MMSRTRALLPRAACGPDLDTRFARCLECLHSNAGSHVLGAVLSPLVMPNTNRGVEAGAALASLLKWQRQRHKAVLRVRGRRLLQPTQDAVRRRCDAQLCRGQPAGTATLPAAAQSRQGGVAAHAGMAQHLSFLGSRSPSTVLRGNTQAGGCRSTQPQQAAHRHSPALQASRSWRRLAAPGNNGS
jgi:hypothetical protein